MKLLIPLGIWAIAIYWLMEVRIDSTDKDWMFSVSKKPKSFKLSIKRNPDR